MALLGLSSPASASPASPVTGHHKVARLCSATPAKGFAACFAVRQTDNTYQPNTPNAVPSGYGPSDLLGAYKLPASGGSGATVAIVDAQDDPKAEADLASYRSQYGLPACTTANGCFKKVNQNGQASPLPSADSGWAGEISLDLDMVSAVCPQCHILLVEADQPSMDDLGAAVNTAVSLGAKYVSNSYGGGEDGSENTSDSSYFHHPGVAITASTGDDGNGVSYPASSKYVTAVGGTSLSRNSSTRGWTESAWSGAGSGCSGSVAKPAFQNGVTTGCTKRAEGDVSAVADPNTGVAVYDTYGASGWQVYGGTSASSPIIASVYA
ncbi:MAG: S53 family peptidase, partial [Jatrophihabitans sp.]